MNVQELIDALSAIEDKSLEVACEADGRGNVDSVYQETDTYQVGVCSRPVVRARPVRPLGLYTELVEERSTELVNTESIQLHPEPSSDRDPYYSRAGRPPKGKVVEEFTRVTIVLR